MQNLNNINNIKSSEAFYILKCLIYFFSVFLFLFMFSPSELSLELKQRLTDSEVVYGLIRNVESWPTFSLLFCFDKKRKLKWGDRADDKIKNKKQSAVGVRILHVGLCVLRRKASNGKKTTKIYCTMSFDPPPYIKIKYICTACGGAENSRWWRAGNHPTACVKNPWIVINAVVRLVQALLVCGTNKQLYTSCQYCTEFFTCTILYCTFDVPHRFSISNP